MPVLLSLVHIWLLMIVMSILLISLLCVCCGSGCCRKRNGGEEKMNDKQAMKIFEDCIDEMYRNSSPPITWKELNKRYRDTKKTFYDKHRITETRYNCIKESYSRQLNNYYQRHLDWFLLDYAPTFKKEK